MCSYFEAGMEFIPSLAHELAVLLLRYGVRIRLMTSDTSHNKDDGSSR